MKVIYITECKQCPYYCNDNGGNKPNCKHPAVMVKHPYAIDRLTPAEGIAEFCTLQENYEVDDGK